MSATMFVFIGYLLVAALTPLPFDFGFFCILILLALFADGVNLTVKFFERGFDGNS